MKCLHYVRYTPSSLWLCSTLRQTMSSSVSPLSPLPPPVLSLPLSLFFSYLLPSVSPCINDSLEYRMTPQVATSWKRHRLNPNWSEKIPVAPFYHWIPETRNLRRFMIRENPFRWDDCSLVEPCLFGDTGIEPADLDFWSEKIPVAPFYHWIPETRNLRRFLVSGIQW